MELKKLSIHNIASIADAEIDFKGESLSGASIFLICGETGAGKSTILDAICLALFEKTPRMSSVSREEIASYDENENKFFANDNAQLLRRGTGEGCARLIFVGNDGKEYEASWEIQRDYKKPDRKLQKPTRTLCALDGSFEENNKRPIEKKILEIIGMDYDQFCRTVMLAQGEFTKFLKSTKNDKSEILEKLTGTEIYSSLGSMIAERYLEKKTTWENINNEIKAHRLLSEDEKSKIKEQIESESTIAEGLIKEREKLLAKLNWITDFRKMSVRYENLKSTLAELGNKMESETFKEESRLVSDYRQAAVAMSLTNEQKKLRNLNAKKNLLFPEYKKNLENVLSLETEKNKELSRVSERVTKTEMEYNKCDMPSINRNLQVLVDKDSKLNALKTALVELNANSNIISDLNDDIQRQNTIIKDCIDSIEASSLPIADLESEVKQLATQLEKMEMSVSQATKEIRATLSEGDICPVCGNKLTQIINDEVFESLISPIRENKRNAEKRLNDILSTRIASVKRKEDAVKRVESILKKIKKAEKSKLSIIDKCQKLAKEVNIDVADLTKKPEIVDESSESLRQEISAVRELQKQAEIIGEQLNAFRKEESEIKKALEDLSKKREKCQLAIKEWETEKRLRDERMEEIESQLAKFFEEFKSITTERLDYLVDIKDTEINSIESRINATTDEHKRTKGGIENLASQIDEISRNKPELSEEENEDFLTENVKKTELEISTKNQEIGKLRQILETDNSERKLVESQLIKEVAAREEMDEWEGLYRLLGDKDGSRFRSVAQSFILRSLLERANSYMSHFTERYTLTCNPGSLAILVVDSFKPSDPQPASILSGGESFMASLSLALALSNLRSAGSGVDMLFIDEGFGTLSPEYLGNVMDTLEKLHQIGGKKVGLISHVPEMKERIPVHINVVRESPALSRISITHL